MAITFGKNNRSIAFDPTSAFPLDARSYFEDYNLAAAAAQTAEEAGGTNSQYYFGQTLVVVDLTKSSANLYIIQPDKTLKQFGESKAITDLTTVVTNLASNVYTKDEANNAIAAAVAAAPHMKRIVVDNKEDIDINAANADQYIYMVPSGLQYEDNKYYEYIVLERIVLDEETKEPVIDDVTGEIQKEKYLEQIGSWEVDLSNYITTDNFNTTITNIQEELDKKIEATNEGDRLISAAEATKLNDLSFIKEIDNNTLKLETNSGKLSVNLISAAQVQDLESTLSSKASSWKGLSEENYTTSDKTKLSNLADIHNINSNELEITNNVLGIKAIAHSKITGLADLLKNKADQTSVDNLTTSLTNLEDKVNELDGRLTWGSLTEQ